MKSAPLKYSRVRFIFLKWRGFGFFVKTVLLLVIGRLSKNTSQPLMLRTGINAFVPEKKRAVKGVSENPATSNMASDGAKFVLERCARAAHAGVLHHPNSRSTRSLRG
jgi:hypothetical protein